MKTKAEKRLKISGVQFIDGDRIETAFESMATWYRRDKKYYIFYQEYQEDGSILSCRLTITENEVELKKTGNGTSILRFCLDGEQECRYQSPMGQLSLQSDTKRLSVDQTDEGISVFLEYALYMAGSIMSDYELRINLF